VVRGAIVSLSVLLVGLVLVGQAVARSSSDGRATVARYESGTVLVGFRANVTPARRRLLERSVGVRSVRPLGFIGSATPAARALERRLGSSFEIGVPHGTVLRAVRRLEAQRRWVRYAEPNYLMRLSTSQTGRPHANASGGAGATPAQCATGATSLTPNDPCFGLQWGDLNTGQTISGSSGMISGTPGADDHVTDAWNVTTGSRSIVIGQVDAGVDATHPDLQGNIWSDPNGILGCPAGTYGFTTIHSTMTCGAPDTDPAPPTSYGGHGTHVAGMMGALGNNGKGVVGVNWQTSILPVKWLSSVGGGGSGGSVGDLINALGLLVNAKDEGVNVRVANDSPVTTTQPSPFDDPALETQLQALNAAHILFVTAAGGAVAPDGTSYSGGNRAGSVYPCAYSQDTNTPNVICVTGTDQNDKLAFWADYGADVQIAAPADNIYSTLENNGYGYISGGSMAAAQVSGAAALILSADPSMSMTALKDDILGNAQPLSSLNGKVFTPAPFSSGVTTGGILDVCAAVPGCASKTSTSVTCSPGSVTPGHGSTCTATVSDTAGGKPVSPAGSVSFATDSAGTFTPSACTLVANPTPGSASCRVTYTPSALGTHHITADYGVTVSPAFSTGSTSLAVTAPSSPPPPSPVPPPHVVLPPSSTTPPTISGSARPTRTLTCQTGTWTGSPTGLTYSWSRDGKQIQGADQANYTVRIGDEASWLNCTVTASNAAGHGSASAAANGRLVALNGTLGCPKPHGRLHGRNLGPLSLGMSRAQAHKQLRQFTRHGAIDDFCLYGGWGIDAVYLSGKRLAALPDNARARFRNRIGLLLTSNPHYAVDKVRPGTSLGMARHQLKLGRPLRIGHTVSYVSHAQRVPVVLQVAHGIVEQIGVADRSLVLTRADQRRLLSGTPRGIVQTRR
jgi:hypothetical protein